MTLEEGLELKEIRMALVKLGNDPRGGSPGSPAHTFCFDCECCAMHGEEHEDNCTIWNALSRIESSYEQEVELMNAVVSAADMPMSYRMEAPNDNKIVIDQDEWDLLQEKIKALAEFREETAEQ